MNQLVDYIFPPVVAGRVPYWRLVLRGISQLCFQSNELTGAFFLAAVLIASPIAAAYLLVTGLMAPAGRMAMGERSENLATGLPGLNPSLVALALPSLFQTGRSNIRMWGVLAILGALLATILIAAIADIVGLVLSAPFVLTTWLILALGWIEDNWLDVKLAPHLPDVASRLAHKAGE